MGKRYEKRVCADCQHKPSYSICDLRSVCDLRFCLRRIAIVLSGNCGVLFGEQPSLTHIMNVEEIAQAMVDMARNEPMRPQMGENGYKRVTSGYRIDQMRALYGQIYRDLAAGMGLAWDE